MRHMSVIAIAALVSALSACTFVHMAPGATKVKVLASAPTSCTKRGEVEVQRLQLHLARLDFRKIQHVVNQIPQHPRGMLGFLQMFEQVRLNRAAERGVRQFRKADHGG